MPRIRGRKKKIAIGMHGNSKDFIYLFIYFFNDIGELHLD